MEGAPTTSFVNVHGKVGKKSKLRFHGLGAVVENDAAGPFDYTNVHVNYAHHLKLASKYYLAAGLSVGFSQYSADYSEMRFEQQLNETAIEGVINDFIFPMFNAGLWLYRADRFYGLSVRSVNAKKIDGFADSRVQRHFTFANGYARRLTGELTFKPAFLINYVGKSRASIDAQVLLSYKDKFDVGLGARSGHGFSALVKIAAIQYLTVGYAYDVTLNKIRYVAGSTHEIVIGLRACKEGNKLHVPCSAYD
jgi:type IX secretion system PorP/SprF family membrane protein